MDNEQTPSLVPSEPETPADVVTNPQSEELDQPVPEAESVESEAGTEQVSTGEAEQAVAPDVDSSEERQPAEPAVTLPPVEWEASESIQYERSRMWYLALIVIAILLAVLAVVLFKLWSFAVLIAVMLFAVLFLSSKSARQLKYRLDSSTFSVQEKQYRLDDFRAFSIVQEGSMYFIKLIPLKRFAPPIDAFFPAEHAEHIIGILSGSIPMEEYKPDLLDKYSSSFRF